MKKFEVLKDYPIIISDCDTFSAIPAGTILTTEENSKCYSYVTENEGKKVGCIFKESTLLKNPRWFRQLIDWKGLEFCKLNPIYNLTEVPDMSVDGVYKVVQVDVYNLAIIDRCGHLRNFNNYSEMFLPATKNDYVTAVTEEWMHTLTMETTTTKVRNKTYIKESYVRAAIRQLIINHLEEGTEECIS